MRNRMLAGLFGSLMAVIMPLLLLGMGENTTPVEAEILPETQNLEPAENLEQPEKGRTVQAIVIHENQKVLTDAEISVAVSVAGEEQSMTLHDYLIGVLMGEMPASFELEALKAQAVAARTYTLRRLERGGVLSDDPGVCQAFLPLSGANEKWGAEWETYLDKLTRAVEETDGEVLTYGGDLISATYFSCSGGKTEAAQAVWGGLVPYLVPVESPGEEDAAGYESSVTISTEEFLTMLGVEKANISAVTYTDGGGVETMTIGGVSFSGTELRSLFDLRSTMFTLDVSGEQAVFTVRGFGHRVGLSQYGAQAMAQQGFCYEEILTWYYTGVTLEPYEA